MEPTMKIDVLLEPDQTPEQLVELAKLCEQAGIQTMWLQNYLSSRDAFLSLVPAVLATSKLRLGVCIVSGPTRCTRSRWPTRCSP
jgi:alkanesulfonate monooxygenase SsuD/methylene tetrahydromethanopterin reductase-like flavin-dependent oxidoreductase (luciferase family)